MRYQNSFLQSFGTEVQSNTAPSRTLIGCFTTSTPGTYETNPRIAGSPKESRADRLYCNLVHAAVIPADSSSGVCTANHDSNDLIILYPRNFLFVLHVPGISMKPSLVLKSNSDLDINDVNPTKTMHHHASHSCQSLPKESKLPQDSLTLLGPWTTQDRSPK